ncbi:MAG: carbon-nitrogen hydrolase family protein [Saprospiraceae bacterium]
MQLTLATAQYPITAFRDFSEWQQHTARWVEEAARQGARLLLFPEYGAMELTSLLPETMQRDLKQQVRGLDDLRAGVVAHYEMLARRWQIVLVAPSLPVIENGRVLNRACVFSAAGLAGYQDKWFMTRFEDEEWGVEAAAPVLSLFETEWGAFGIQICYDVEFPLGAGLLGAAGANLILAPSCTETIRGATRVHVGARARALENQCYVAVAQTVGDAPWSPAVDVNYGFSAVYTTPDRDLPEEGIVAVGTPQQPGWLVQCIDFEKIKAARLDGQVFNFKDQQRVRYQLDGQMPEVRRIRI